MPFLPLRPPILICTYLCGIVVLFVALSKMSATGRDARQQHDHGHGLGHAHGHDGKDMWSGEDYLKRPGTQETAVVSHDSVVHALQSAGITHEQLSKLNLLEIGCGAGAVTQHYAKTFGSVHAIDTSPSMLLTLSSRLPEKTTYSLHALNKDSAAEFASGKTMLAPTPEQPQRQLALPRSAFNVAVANLVVHHVDDLDGFMQGIFSLLEPGGWVVFTEFTKKESKPHQSGGTGSTEDQGKGKYMVNGSVNAPEHYHQAFSEASIIALLEKYGFVDAHAEIRGRLPVFEVEADWPPCLIVRGRKP